MNYYGDKFEQLENFRPTADKLGLFVPPSHGISQEFIDGLLYEASRPSISEAEAAAETDYTDIQMSELDDMLMEYAGELSRVYEGPLILRSSGEGDAVGVGVYESAMHGVHLEDVRFAFNSVLASYFSEEARIFRQRMGYENKFAMFMQPMVGSTASVLPDDGQFEGVTINGNEISIDDSTVFLTPFSGNVTMGTPRTGIGIMRLQPGHGSAVDYAGYPAFNLNSEDRLYDPMSAERAIQRRIEREVSARDPRDPYRKMNGLMCKPDGRWEDNYLYTAFVSTWGTEYRIGDIKEQLASIYEEVDNSATYMEFAVRRSIDDGDQLYVIQKGDLRLDVDTAIDLNLIDGGSVVEDSFRVEAGVNSYKEVGSLVCIGGPDHTYVREFDRSEEASSGYVIVYGARQLDDRKLDIRNLENLQGIVALESMEYSHSGHPEDHLIGYSEQLGIPILSMLRWSTEKAWGKLNGAIDLMPGYTKTILGDVRVHAGGFIIATNEKEGLIARKS